MYDASTECSEALLIDWTRTPRHATGRRAAVAVTLALAACTSAGTTSEPPPSQASGTADAASADGPSDASATPSPAASPTPTPVGTVPAVGEPLPFTLAELERTGSEGPGLSTGAVVVADGRTVVVGSTLEDDGSRRPVAFARTGEGAWSVLDTSRLPGGVLRAAVTAGDGRVVAVGREDLPRGEETAGRQQTAGLVAVLPAGADALEQVAAQDELLRAPDGLAVTDITRLPADGLLALAARGSGTADERPIALRSDDGTSWTVDEELTEIALTGARPQWAFVEALPDRTLVAVSTLVDGLRVERPVLSSADGWVEGQPWPGTDAIVTSVAPTGQGAGGLLAVGGVRTQAGEYTPATWASVDGASWDLGDAPVLDVLDTHNSTKSFGELFESIVAPTGGELLAIAFLRASFLPMRSTDGGQSWVEVPIVDVQTDTQVPFPNELTATPLGPVAILGGSQPAVLAIGEDSAVVEMPDAFPRMIVDRDVYGLTATSDGDLLTIVSTSRPREVGRVDSRFDVVVRTAVDGQEVARSRLQQDAVLRAVVERAGSIDVVGHDQFAAVPQVTPIRLTGDEVDALRSRPAVELDGYGFSRWFSAAALDDGPVAVLGSHFTDTDDPQLEPLAVRLLEDSSEPATVPEPVTGEVMTTVCPLEDGRAVALGSLERDGIDQPSIWRTDDAAAAWTRDAEATAGLEDQTSMFACGRTTDGPLWTAGFAGSPREPALWRSDVGRSFERVELPRLGEDGFVDDLAIAPDGRVVALVRTDDGLDEIGVLLVLSATGDVELVQPLRDEVFVAATELVEPYELEVVDDQVALLGYGGRQGLLFTAPLP